MRYFLVRTRRYFNGNIRVRIRLVHLQRLPANELFWCKGYQDERDYFETYAEAIEYKKFVLEQNRPIKQQIIDNTVPL